MGARQKQFRGDDIFADQTHVVPRRHGLEDLQRVLIDLVHFLDHDHGVGPARKRVAGVDVCE